MSTIYQIKLIKVVIDENGRMEEERKGNNSLTATLHYPRSGTPGLTSIRPLRLKDKEPLDYSREELKKQVIFKELIQGDSEMEIEISAIEKEDKIAKIIQKFLKIATGAMIGIIPGLGPIATAVASSATDSFFDSLDNEDKVSVLGKGAIVLDETLADGKITIDLFVPNTVVIKQLQVDQSFKIKTLNKNDLNGHVTLELKKIA